MMEVEIDFFVNSDSKISMNEIEEWLSKNDIFPSFRKIVMRPLFNAFGYAVWTKRGNSFDYRITELDWMPQFPKGGNQKLTLELADEEAVLFILKFSGNNAFSLKSSTIEGGEEENACI